MNNFPKLVITEDWEGYEYQELLNFLESYRNDFINWFSGQTGGMIGNKFYVYKDDFDKFLRHIGLSIGGEVKKK